MKNYIKPAVVLGATLLICLGGCGDSVTRERNNLVKQFLACTSDSLEQGHRQPDA